MATRRQEDPSRSPSSPLTPEARHDLSSTLYKELHRLAVGKMRFERGNHTLQPTALVNEAYLRLADGSDSMWADRSRVLGLAANVMRHILVDHARAHNAGKRGDGQLQVTLVEDMAGGTTSSTADVLAVDEALTRLAEFDSRQAKVLEMHFFGGLTFDEIALQLDVSIRTVKRDWTMARAWLRQELSPNRNMTPELWQRLKPLFHAALEETTQDRAAFIEAACGDDLELKMHLKRLLDADQQTADSRDAPLAHIHDFLDDNGAPLPAGLPWRGGMIRTSSPHDRPNHLALSNPGNVGWRRDGCCLQGRGFLPRPVCRA